MAVSNLVISVRNVKTVEGRKIFGGEPGPTLYLDVPDGKVPDPHESNEGRSAASDSGEARQVKLSN